MSCSVCNCAVGNVDDFH